MVEPPQQEFATVNEAVRTLVARSSRRQTLDAAKDALAKGLAAELDRLQRSLRAVDAELSEAGRDAEHERIGSLIMAQLQSLRKGMKEADLENLFGEGETVHVKLNPALSPVENAEEFFSKARRARASRTESERRRKALEQQERAMAALVTECDGCTTADDVEEFQERHAKQLRRLKIMTERQSPELPPFRTFTVTGGYEVWVGKSSTNNDLLTMKYAKPHDLWFHARGSSGSHAILRVSDRSTHIPKEAIRQAAGIAAYYSKMRKAKSVPVAWCERKYVRKPKGVPPGTVTLEREEVMFVDPRLPEG
jgi:predicted ribosome quality control (RQC) complex YloA/Tae2 family protein